MDKIGEDGVLAELSQKGISDSAIERIKPLFQFAGSNQEKLQLMRSYLSGSEVGMKGIEELEYVMNVIDSMGLKRANLEFDLTLARGLNYYTGAIFEVKANNVNMGSICGGGRYDDLTGLFGLKGLSGVGISFGADRIYDVMTELDLFPASVTSGLKVLFIHFGEQEVSSCLRLARQLREKNIDCEVYPSAAKLQKQLKYANDRSVQYVVLLGEEEFASETLTLKNMESGAQEKLSYAEFLTKMEQL